MEKIRSKYFRYIGSVSSSRLYNLNKDISRQTNSLSNKDKEADSEKREQ